MHNSATMYGGRTVLSRDQIVAELSEPDVHCTLCRDGRRPRIELIDGIGKLLICPAAGCGNTGKRCPCGIHQGRVVQPASRQFGTQGHGRLKPECKLAVQCNFEKSKRPGLTQEQALDELQARNERENAPAAPPTPCAGHLSLSSQCPYPATVRVYTSNGIGCNEPLCDACYKQYKKQVLGNSGALPICGRSFAVIGQLRFCFWRCVIADLGSIEFPGTAFEDLKHMQPEGKEETEVRKFKAIAGYMFAGQVDVPNDRLLQMFGGDVQQGRGW